MGRTYLAGGRDAKRSAVGSFWLREIRFFEQGGKRRIGPRFGMGQVGEMGAMGFGTCGRCRERGVAGNLLGKSDTQVLYERGKDGY